MCSAIYMVKMVLIWWLPGIFRTVYGHDGGKLRSKKRWFTGMVEVALFADILNKSAEFERHVREPGDFQNGRCCCPVWIANDPERGITNYYRTFRGQAWWVVRGLFLGSESIRDAVTDICRSLSCKRKRGKRARILMVDYAHLSGNAGYIWCRQRFLWKNFLEDKRTCFVKGRRCACTGGVSSGGDYAAAAGWRLRHRTGEWNKRVEMMRRIQNKRDRWIFEDGCVGGCV